MNTYHQLNLSTPRSSRGFSNILLLIGLALPIVLLLGWYWMGLEGTPYPATHSADQIVLTWSGDPRSTQTIQWRTGADTPTDYVYYIADMDLDNEAPVAPKTQRAESKRLWWPFVLNDPLNFRHTVTLQNLRPGTTYRYAIGSAAGETPERWSTWSKFRTAPEQPEDFSFVFMGDVQKGFVAWGDLLHQARQRHPAAAFYLLAGDLVNRGKSRAEWDRFFFNAGAGFSEAPLLPALGNHEYIGLRPWLYLKLFTLPDNGPSPLDAGQVYSLHYGAVQIVVLNSSWPAVLQNAWLDHQLGASDATWKIVMVHFPLYASALGRDNKHIRKNWGPIFDRHHVDLVLQGHDHNYMRTHPLRGGRVMNSPAEGTIYIVANAGSKYYPQGEADYMAVAHPKISTYQIIDIETGPLQRLRYRAYDSEGRLWDNFQLMK